MKCPYCGSEYAGKLQYCPSCKQPLSRAEQPNFSVYEDNRADDSEVRTRPQKAFIAFTIILCCILFSFGAYKVFYWVNNYRLIRLYTRGEYTPTVNIVKMEDGRQGHTIAFYGKDGDQIFLPELERSVVISGGVARVTIPDSDWFSGDVTDVESAMVYLTPVLIDEKGMRTQLPEMDLEIEVPTSPLEVISPSSDDLKIVTAHYQMQLQVVPGSSVQINGEDVTDMVSRNGLLSQNINVYPIGDNIYTIVVDTPQHHQTRHEVKIYREIYDIDVELDTTVSTISRTANTTISGRIESGASLIVDTPYVHDSMIHDSTTGNFTFVAKLTSFGENVVRFRAKMDGRQDAVVSVTVDYTPTEDDYAGSAWGMDYKQLCALYEQWNGKVFRCDGVIADVFTEGSEEYLVMDVSTDHSGQYLILQNKSAVAKPVAGQKCVIFADVCGRSMYKDEYYPMLAARYIYFSSN